MTPRKSAPTPAAKRDQTVLKQWLEGRKGGGASRSKYGVDRSEAGKRRRTFEGVVYDSQAEMAYAAQLQMRVKSGELYSVDRQWPIALIVNGHTVCKLVVDFLLTWPTGKRELHDVKGMVTRDWRIKAKLFEAIYGYPIVEVHNGVVKEAKKRSKKR